MRQKKPELLAPVAGWERLRAAVDAGADSVYFGVKGLNMRASARNFSVSELKKVASFCRSRNVRAYLALNTIVYENELSRACAILKKAKSAGIDAVILWDMAVLGEAKKLGIEVHLSTQASVSNSEAAEFYRKQGVSRIVLARECSLKQIKEIKKKTKAEIEVFVHGAMCVSVSGRCFMSHEIFGRSANRGNCIQPCRREYIVRDAEEGHELILGKGYVMSPKDLCTLPFIGKIIDSGADALKIEGRSRSPEYIKAVVSAYRNAIDLYCEGKLNPEKSKELIQQVGQVYNRGFSAGFYLRIPGRDGFASSGGSIAERKKKYIGFVRNYYSKPGVAEIKLEAGNISKGDSLLFIGNKTGVLNESAGSMISGRNHVEIAEKGRTVCIKISGRTRKNDKVYVFMP